MQQAEPDLTPASFTPRSITTAEHYQRGDTCDGWRLVYSPELSIIQERIPPGTAEQYHCYQRAQQFFYVLQGTATFEVEDQLCTVVAQQGLYIPPWPGIGFSTARRTSWCLPLLPSRKLRVTR